MRAPLIIGLIFFGLMMAVHQNVQAQLIRSQIIESERLWLDRGHEAEQAGDNERALQLWELAWQQMEIPSTRIATEYIRVATENDLENYYAVADMIYDWGISEEAMTSLNYTALFEELSRLEPLIDPDLFSEWRRLLAGNNPDLLQRITTFWETVDPMPDHSYNIRLLEHWERIAYARANYSRESVPPYGTDVRGKYYVAYGEPDRLEEGQLNYSLSQVTRILTEIDGKPPIGGNPIPVDAQIFETIQLAYKEEPTDLRYEIWSYDSPNDEMFYNMVVTFGQKAGGPFGTIHTPDDFIPPSLLRKSGKAAVILQWRYYEFWSNKDRLYADLFLDVKSWASWDSIRRERDMEETPPTGLPIWQPYTGRIIQQENTAYYAREQVAAPDEFSTEEKLLPGIPLELHQYRILNEQGQPALLSFVESYPSLAFEYDLSANREQFGDIESQTINAETAFDNYTITHGLRLGDAQGNRISYATHQPTLFIDFDNEISSTSVFTLPAVTEGASQIVNARLENHDPDSQPRMESLFPASVRGFGKLGVPQPVSLVNSGNLLLSDLILGFQRETNPPEDAYLPFVVSNKRLIPENENLAIHFEVYNLQQDPSGIASFEVDYELTSVTRVLLFNNRNVLDEASITLSFQTDADRFAESVEIQTQALEPGRYELSWTVRDLNNGQTTSRELEFEVIESEKVLSEN